MLTRVILNRAYVKKCISCNVSTHEIFNQSLPLQNYNLLNDDPSLIRSLKAFHQNQTQFDDSAAVLNDHGNICGSLNTIELADQAERNKPQLRQFDAYGRRIDVVDYHPSYHSLMKLGLQAGAATFGYNNKEAGSHITRAGLIYFQNQVEPGHCCPIVMTAAAIPVLKNADCVENWLQKSLVQNYDPSNQSIETKSSVSIGMSMTEKQGGSDVRANTTIAKPLHSKEVEKGELYELNGHKWFTSAPMSDGFLTLAKINDLQCAPSCFLVPRWHNGSRNSGFKIMRLKEKCGDRANASSEVEYDNALGILISEPGKGVKAIIEMVQSTRLDCCLGTVGGMRRALHHSLLHTSSRSAFGKTLIKHPLMENLLVDMCLDVEACTLTAFRLAAAFDSYQQSGDIAARELFRVGVSVSKYYITKLQPRFIYECMEIFGGNGYAEDLPLAKLFRQSPLNSIWEGSGNVICLDVLRGFDSISYLLEEISLAKGMDKAFDIYLLNLINFVSQFSKNPQSLDNQRQARILCDQIAVCFQASLLLRFSTSQIAESFIASRLAKQNLCGVNYGATFNYSAALTQDIIHENIPKLKKIYN